MRQREPQDDGNGRPRMTAGSSRPREEPGSLNGSEKMEGSRKDAWRKKVCERELRWEMGAGGVRRRRKKY